MTEGELEDGQTRVGWITFRGNTYGDQPCALIREKRSVRVVMPTTGNSPFRRWATQQSGESSSNANLAMPTRMMFRDAYGAATLLGLSGGGLRYGITGSEVRLRADRIVFDDQSTYEKINGLRTRIIGLSQWVSLRSLTVSAEHDMNRLRSADFALRAPGPVKLQRALNFRFYPWFSYNMSAYGDTTEINQGLILETQVGSRREWDEHIRIHVALGELMAVAAWHPFTPTQYTVKDSLHGSPDDDWVTALDFRPWRHDYQERKHYMFWFQFEDIGSAGVGRWLSLLRRFRRGLLPIIDTIYSPRTPTEIKAMQAAIAIDGIGYQMALESGVSRSNAKNETHAKRLDRVYSSIRTVLPFSREDYVASTKTTYNSTKHTDREERPLREHRKAQLMHQLVFRAWVSQNIGVSGQLIQSALSVDPVARAVQK